MRGRTNQFSKDVGGKSRKIFGRESGKLSMRDRTNIFTNITKFSVEKVEKVETHLFGSKIKILKNALQESRESRNISNFGRES